jgi:hypothetical protein
VLANEVRDLADNTSRVFAWDEAFNLIERSSEAKGIAEPEIEATVAEAELEVEPVQFQEALERRIETANEGQANPEGLWLIPVKASLAQSPGSSQMLMAPVEYASRDFALEMIEIVDPASEVQAEMVENTTESIGDRPRK